MEKSIVHSSYSSSSISYGGRITRSMTKCARDAEGAVVGGNSNGSSLKNSLSSPPYPKQVSSKRRKTRKMPFLPEEILFRIFLLLPAKILHEVMRNVCRTWRKIIRDPNFIKAHLRRSPVTPVFHKSYNSYFTASFLDRDETTGKFNEEMSGGLINLEIPQRYLTHGDGLLLTRSCRDRSILYVINPLTKQIVTLPRLPVSYPILSRLFAVGCSPSTLECKVAYTHCISESSTDTTTTYILTVGVDKEWRAILEEPSKKFESLFQSKHALGIWGFIYWFGESASYLIALDVEKEVFYKVLFPEEYRGRSVLHSSSDRFLSFAVRPCDGSRSDLIEVEFLELVDCKSGGEWRKLGRIDWESKRRELNEMGFQIGHPCGHLIWPVTVLNNRNVAIFHLPKPNFTYVAYNFKTGNFFRWLDVPRKSLVIGQFRHVNSLVVLKTYSGSPEEEEGIRGSVRWVLRTNTSSSFLCL